MAKGKQRAQMRDAASKMVLGEFVRLAKAFQEGKPLTASERSFVLRMAEKGASESEQAAKAPTSAKNFVQLAKVLGFSRQALHEWKKLEGAPKPGANGKHSVKAWREFIAANGLGEVHNAGKDTESGAEAKDRRAKTLADREEFEFAILRKEYVRIEDVRRSLGEMITAFKVELMSSAVRTAGSLAGMTAAEILDRLRQENHRVLSHLHRGEWTKHEAEPGGNS